MKTNRLFLAGVLLLLPLLCQAQGLFAKYSDMNNVSSVYISKAMIEMNPELYTKDVNVGKLAKQLELVQILSTMDNGIKRMCSWACLMKVLTVLSDRTTMRLLTSE